MGKSRQPSFSTKALTVYRAWDVTLPIVPPRSRLYRLAPLGIGTPGVESLSSYLMRLAAAHAVETGTLFAMELVPAARYSYLLHADGQPRLGALSLVKEIHTINGVSRGCATWVTAVETLTLDDGLRHLTLLAWKNLLTLRALTRTARAWCPACFNEQRERTEEIRELLCWTLQAVTVCARHRTGLETLCPRCRRASPVLMKKARPGYCFRCQRWLGMKHVPQLRDDEQTTTDGEMTSRFSVATTIGEMLSLSPYLERVNQQSSLSISALLSAHIDRLTKGNTSAFAQLIGFDYLSVKQLKAGINLPPVENFVRLLERLRISARDFLDGKEARLPVPDQRPITLLPCRRERVMQYAEAALRDPSRPSLTEVTHKLGYRNAGHLRQICPALCIQITARHKPLKPPLTIRDPYYDDPTLRAALTLALDDHPAPSVQRLAERLGYKSAGTLARRCPDLYRRLKIRHAAHRQQELAHTGALLQAVLREEPPPTLRAVRIRLGYRHDNALIYQHPELCRAITLRYQRSLEAKTRGVEKALKRALKQHPPPSVQHLARTEGRGTTWLYRRFPELCRRLAARRQAHLARSSEVRRQTSAREIKRAVISLHAADIYPSQRRVAQTTAAPHCLRSATGLTAYREAIAACGLR